MRSSNGTRDQPSTRKGRPYSTSRRFPRNERCSFYFRLRKSPQQNEGGFYLHTMLSRDQVARVLLGLGYVARPDPEDHPTRASRRSAAAKRSTRSAAVQTKRSPAREGAEFAIWRTSDDVEAS